MQAKGTLMLGARDLKAKISVTDTKVDCPVKGCHEAIKRQRKYFRREPQYQCPSHGIYISPSTFEYENELDNLLWKDSEDLALLKRIKSVKRESRMARDNSEDALTWNAFRYLEKNGQTSEFLSWLVGFPVRNPETIYWSYSQKVGGVYPSLARAREEFGESPQRSSEPDLIISSDSALFFVEAKLTAANETTPSNKDNTKRYLTGGDEWYRKVFNSDYETIAIKDRKYELMRFWLLGSWMAAQQGYKFFLLNLVRAKRDKDIEHYFMPHLRRNAQRDFLRTTWEDLFRFIYENVSPDQRRNVVLDYYENKTIGYSHLRELELAFSIQDRKSGTSIKL